MSITGLGGMDLELKSMKKASDTNTKNPAFLYMNDLFDTLIPADGRSWHTHIYRYIIYYRLSHLQWQ